MKASKFSFALAILIVFFALGLELLTGGTETTLKGMTYVCNGIEYNEVNTVKVIKNTKLVVSKYSPNIKEYTFIMKDGKEATVYRDKCTVTKGE